MTTRSPEIAPQQQWARCGACDHSWHLCTLPMDVSKVCRVFKGAHCPACGQDSKRLFLLATGRTS